MPPVMLDAAPPADEFLADKAYDSDRARADLIGRGIRPVIPNKDDRKVLNPFDRERYTNALPSKACSVLSRTSGATRYHKLARIKHLVSPNRFRCGKMGIHLRRVP